LATRIQTPAFLPEFRYTFNEYLLFDVNAPAVVTAVYFVYYLILEPFAAVSLSYVIDASVVPSDIGPSCCTHRKWRYHY
jgi:hypothetical protein